MKRVRLGVCMADKEFSDRFIGCIARHYQQLEMHIFTDIKLFCDAVQEIDIALVEGQMPAGADWKIAVPIVYLFDFEEDVQVPKEKEGLYLVEKYQEVNRIVDEIMKHIGEEIRNVAQTGELPIKTRTIAVYSLSENEYQLPLAVTLASILGEQERVLLLDLQENSGMSQLIGEPPEVSLEELLVMIEGKKFSQSRMMACIGHLDRLDYVYPAGNTECLCETSSATYRQLICVLAREMDYNTVIINLGSRFAGFFELLEESREIYLLKSRGGLGKWRQKEFLEEIDKHGMAQIRDRVKEIAIPMMTGPMINCERLIEQWKWDDFGDSIRRMMPEVMGCG